MTSQNQTVQQQGTHHWVITVELPGRAMQTLYGTYTPPAGATRHDVFLAIKNDLAQQSPEMARANVVFFALELNQL
ncbi:hypothetical protein CP981_11205 [Streptomyces platensis]|uniref:Uncharacterized protein n=1 Tax=Streptomyces platensis TaxID=58346 RepID=A0AAE6TLW7_STRPT|nr:hypothetical protein [Streptomyces platensis]OSY35958.1 hypothetical protein BG653_06983 [Streptomyces platensis]QEV52159.1 hypothetical protein CP981_11205 [Streptomyces platensis]